MYKLTAEDIEKIEGNTYFIKANIENLAKFYKLYAPYKGKQMEMIEVDGKMYEIKHMRITGYKGGETLFNIEVVE